MVCFKRPSFGTGRGPDLLWFFPGAQPVCLGHYLADVHTHSRLGVPNLHARAQRQPALEASNTKTARFGARTLRLLLPEVCRSGHAQEVRNKPYFRSRSRILISERSVCADGRGGRHEAAKHGRSKPRNQRWIDFLRSTAGKPYAACDVAGAGNGLTVRLVSHSHRKRGETDRPRLRSTAPALDPTAVDGVAMDMGK